MIMMGMDIPLNAIRRQISTGVDIIVHVTRMRDKSRRVEEIREILGMDGDSILTQVLYAFEEKENSKEGEIIGNLKKKGELLRVEKLKKAGILREEPAVCRGVV